MVRSKIQSSIILQNKINDLYTKGMGYQAIANELNREGYKISHMSIKRYLDTFKNKKTEVLNQDAELASKVKQSILDTTDQLQKTNKVLWGMLEEAKVSKTFKLSVLKEIRSTIQLADELMKEFRGLKIEQGPQSKIQLIQVIVNKLQDLEESGEIKILNPKLKKEVVVDGESKGNKENIDKGKGQHNNT